MPPAARPASAFLPLTPQVLQILLSLSDGPVHGYAVINDIRDRTDGEMRLTASTLYDALARLLDQSLIAEVDPVDGERDSRRRYYALTATGRDVLAAETRRLERLLAMARQKRALRERR
jgi:DNA-binding PadR family transcriptional regulator